MTRKPHLLIPTLVFCLCAGCATNPITGKQEFMLIPEEQDIQIGRKYAPEIEKQMGGRIPDPDVQAYVNQVGQNIARVSHKPDIEYHFVALQNKSINALALPGGFIFITKGMLEKLQSEAQLAGILGHEITHVVARDVANTMSKQIGMELLLSAVTPENAPRGALTVADLTTQIIGLRFSRQDERDADLGGLDYMAAAGYDPYAMVETMQMLSEQNKTRSVEFLSTHPSPENRSAYLRQRIHAKYFNFTTAKVGKQQYRAAVLDRLNNPN